MAPALCPPCRPAGPPKELLPSWPLSTAASPRRGTRTRRKTRRAQSEAEAERRPAARAPPSRWPPAAENPGKEGRRHPTLRSGARLALLACNGAVRGHDTTGTERQRHRHRSLLRDRLQTPFGSLSSLCLRRAKQRAGRLSSTST